MMSEPMGDERLTELQARVKNCWEMQAVGPDNLGDLEPQQLQAIAVAYVDDVADLLAEVERLREVVETCALADCNDDELRDHLIDGGDISDRDDDWYRSEVMGYSPDGIM